MNPAPDGINETLFGVFRHKFSHPTYRCDGMFTDVIAAGPDPERNTITHVMTVQRRRTRKHMATPTIHGKMEFRICRTIGSMIFCRTSCCVGRFSNPETQRSAISNPRSWRAIRARSSLVDSIGYQHDFLSVSEPQNMNQMEYSRCYMHGVSWNHSDPVFIRIRYPPKWMCVYSNIVISRRANRSHYKYLLLTYRTKYSV